MKFPFFLNYTIKKSIKHLQKYGGNKNVESELTSIKISAGRPQSITNKANKQIMGKKINPDFFNQSKEKWYRVVLQGLTDQSTTTRSQEWKNGYNFLLLETSDKKKYSMQRYSPMKEPLLRNPAVDYNTRFSSEISLYGVIFFHH